MAAPSWSSSAARHANQHRLASPARSTRFFSRTLTTSDGQTLRYDSLLTWISLATALHLPATAIPAGATAAGLPVGAQLIGPRGGDARILAIAQAIEETVRGFVAPGI